MRLDHVCTKKDKRLLVLLALSPLILCPDITFFTNYNSVEHDYSWIEIAGDENLTYRYELTKDSVDFTAKRLLAGNGTLSLQAIAQLDKSMKQGRAVALEKVQGKYETGTQISPRLAFFLGQPFSINAATIEDLTLIPGIGEVLASNIITYREAHGPITHPSQLENITGIGPQIQQKLENYFTYRVDGE